MVELCSTEHVTRTCRSWYRVGAGLICFLLLSLLPITAQVMSGNLSGTVADTSGAVVPKADVELKNVTTNDIRKTVSDNSGYFHFAAVPRGTYTVTISAQGFASWKNENLVVNQGENLTLPNIRMKIASDSQEVTVVSSAAGVIPTDTGESRTTLNTTMVTDLGIQGRNTGELIKFMPGMAMNTGLNQQSYNSLVTKTGDGPIGQFSASGGQPYGGLQLTTDGASIVDPGNQGGSLANINQDQTAEVTYLNSAFGADTAKGPTVFQSTSKGGGSSLHGGAYLYARHSIFNSMDAYLKSNQSFKKPEDSYYYPGFTVGGPILIPGTGLNKNRDKLFFFVGYEYMRQTPAGTLHQVTVPTADMLKGNFSDAVMAPFSKLGGGVNNVPCSASQSAQWWYNNYCGAALGQKEVNNGQILTSAFDSNSLALVKLMPSPNQDPAAHNGYNYAFLDTAPANRWELRARGDWNINQNTKFYLIYTRQNEGDLNNFGIWWWPSDSLMYPTQVSGKTTSQTWSASLVHIFGPSVTNEALVTWSNWLFPNKPADASKVNPANVGFAAKMPFDMTGKIAPQIPNLLSWGCNSGGSSGCFPGWYAPSFPASFQGGAFGNHKKVPSVQDNLTWVLGTHSLKFGAYWSFNYQSQTNGWGDGAWGQGRYEFDNWASNTTGNPLADLLLGHAQSFNQANKTPVLNMGAYDAAFYAQDGWKMTRRLTVNYGLRFSHQGQWFPTQGAGLAVWDPSSYSNAPYAPTYTGMVWNGKDKSIPKSGFESVAFSPDFRGGAAYDLRGDGRTVLRGGFGIYRWQFAINDVNPALTPTLGVQVVNTPGLMKLSDAANYTPAAENMGNCQASASCGSYQVIQKGDDRTPYTQNWNVIVSQQVPWRSLVEIEYSGNRTRNALLTGNGSNMNFISNINKIPVGALFGADPVTGINYYQQSCAAGSCQTPSTSTSSAIPVTNQDYRPYRNYGALNLIQHGSYSNYNAMMISWQKQQGAVTFLANYTWSKVMGIRDGQTNNGNGDGATVDPFNIRNNYGPLAYDHSHIFNVAYVVKLPSFVHHNLFLKGAVNGWTVSGTSQLQAGAPIQPSTGGTLNITWPTSTPTGYVGLSNAAVLGTDSQILMPQLTCNPKGKKYFDVNCFAAPTISQQTASTFSPQKVGPSGPTVWPYIKGPAYQNHDLGLYKTFKFLERNNVEFRIFAFNFLNHPLPQFGNNDINLIPAYGGTNTNSNTKGVPLYKYNRRVMELAIKYSF